MTRQEFESLSSREQRKVAEREYKAVSELVFTGYMDSGVYSDDYGQFTEIHHAWYRSHAPLWYLFQPKNMFPISQWLHHIIHFKAPSDMTPKEREYYDRFQEVKEQLKQENADYESRL
jgi:hypothetical protein